MILESLTRDVLQGWEGGGKLDQQPPNADKVINGGGEEVILLDAVKGGTAVDWRTFSRREDGSLTGNKVPS